MIILDDIQGEEYSGQSIEDIAEDIMQVSTPQYSEKKEQMYLAAKEYFEALEKGTSVEDLQKIKARMDLLAAEYSDNPAYCALLQQQYLQKRLI